MFGIFKKEHGSTANSTGRPPRHSRGWAEVRGYLQKADSLRVLDFVVDFAGEYQLPHQAWPQRVHGQRGAGCHQA